MAENRLARKLRHFARLSDADRLRLADAIGSVRTPPAHADVPEQGENPQGIEVILDGWACRCRLLADRRRQIVALMLPGALGDPQAFLQTCMDHTVSTLKPVMLARIPGAAFRSLIARSPSLAFAFRREGLHSRIKREWTVSLGWRSGIERLAHLFCEVHARLVAVGLTEARLCPCPLRQNDLADTLGQISVHINRILRELRGTGPISLQGRHLAIHNTVNLAKLAQSDSIYLHFIEKAGS